jgi:hypothetical protein
MEEQSSRRGVPGPAPLSPQREEYVKLVARGVSSCDSPPDVEPSWDALGHYCLHKPLQL